MPKISVIVPVYNTAPKYIDAALESLFNQTISDLEIIVVNDGSTAKDTCEYLEKIKKNKKLRIINQSNMGLSGARNSALSVANGDFIGFLDSDDWIDNDFYNRLYRRCVEDNADIACGVLCVHEKNNTFNIDRFPECLTGDIKAKMGNTTNGSVCSKIFKRSLFEDIKFPMGLYYEDNLTLLELMLRSDLVAFIPDVHYNYRSTPNSIVHDKSRHAKRVRDSVEILGRIKAVANTCPKAQRDVIINTFLRILFMANVYAADPEYRKSMDRLFGARYLAPFVPDAAQPGRTRKIANKIKRFFFRVQDGRVKIFKITVYKTKG